MRVKLQLVICHDDDHEETVTDVITLNKNHKRIEHLGLSLAESKQLLGTLQRQILQQQVNTFLDTHSACPDCGTPLDLKARGSKSFRTLFGTFKFTSPRLEHCDCKRRKTASFRPLSALLTEPVAPELLYMESKWSSLVSYGLSLDALQDFLPIDLSLDVKTVRYDTLKVAKRLEAELGEDQGDCSKDTGLHLSCPRLMQGLKGLLTPFALGFSPHVERNSGFDLILRADTVNAFLHLPITPIATFHRIGGRREQFVIEKGQGFLQGRRIEFLQRLAQMLEPVQTLPQFGEFVERRLRPAPSIEQGVDLLHEFT
jgi:hypothetical protein